MINVEDYNNMEQTVDSFNGMNQNMWLFDPNTLELINQIAIITNIVSLVFFITTAIGLFLINKKLGEKYPWLSFVPLVQIYNYFTASKKPYKEYLLFPFIALIAGLILAPFTLGLTFIIVFIYMLIMFIKLLHGISVRTGRGAWTTLGLFIIPGIMFPIVGYKMKDKTLENKIDTNTNQDENNDEVL